MDTKGNMDNLTIPILLLILAIGVVVSYVILNSVSDAFAGTPTANNLIQSGKLMFSRIGNTSFVMMAVALILFNVIGAVLLVTYPAFMIVDVILFPITILIGAVVSNAYESSLASLTVINVAATFPVMNFFMLHLPTTMAVVQILTAIGAYALVKNA